MPAATAISSMNDCITNETPLVPGARSAPVGMLNGVIGAECTEKFATKPRGNSLAGRTDAVLATKSRKARSLPEASRPALK